jgi:hypothetical protein
MTEQRDSTRSGAWAGLQDLFLNRTTEPNLVPIEAADAADLATAITLANEMKAKVNKIISNDNRRLARLRDAGIYVAQAAQAQLGATVGLAGNADVATLVALKSEGDAVRAAINAVLALFRTELILPLTGGSAIADVGANVGLANNDGAATLVATKAEIDETIAAVNTYLAKLRLTVLSGGVPANVAAAVGLANNANVATLVLLKAEHDTLRAKFNAILTRSAAIGILSA